MHKWSFPIKAGESQSLACKHHRSHPFVVPVSSKECAGCVVFFVSVSAGLWAIRALNTTGSSKCKPPQWPFTTTMKYQQMYSKIKRNRLKNCRRRMSVRPHPHLPKKRNVFWTHRNPGNSYILLWMIPHPQEKTPPIIPGDVIGKERRLNDRIARNSQWFTSLQSRSTEVRKTQNTWQH